MNDWPASGPSTTESTSGSVFELSGDERRSANRLRPSRTTRRLHGGAHRRVCGHGSRPREADTRLGDHRYRTLPSSLGGRRPAPNHDQDRPNRRDRVHGARRRSRRSRRSRPSGVPNPRAAGGRRRDHDDGSAAHDSPPAADVGRRHRGRRFGGRVRLGLPPWHRRERRCRRGRGRRRALLRPRPRPTPDWQVADCDQSSLRDRGHPCRHREPGCRIHRWRDLDRACTCATKLPVVRRSEPEGARVRWSARRGRCRRSALRPDPDLSPDGQSRGLRGARPTLNPDRRPAVERRSRRYPEVSVVMRMSQGPESHIDGGTEVAKFDGTDVSTIDPGSLLNGDQTLGQNCGTVPTPCLPLFRDTKAYVGENSTPASTFRSR